MQRLEKATVDAKLQMLIRHLVLSFLQATIFSREVEEQYAVVVIAPYDGGPDKVIQVERAWLAKQPDTMEAFRRVLENLNLPTVLQRYGRYDLGSADWSDPANARWLAAQGSDVVSLGRLHLSGPSLPSSARAVFPARA